MSLFGSLFGSDKKNTGNSRSDTRNNSNASTIDASLGGNVWSPNFGAVNAPVEINTLDNEAIDKSFNFSSSVADDAIEIIDNGLSFVAGAVSKAISTTVGSTQSNKEIVNSALEFSAGSQVNNNQTLMNTLEFIDGETDDNLAFVSGAVGDVLEFAYQDVSDTKQFTAGLTTKVLDESKESYERNLEALQETQENALYFASGSFDSAVNSIRSGADKAMNFLQDSSSMILGGLAEFTADEAQNNRAYQVDAIDAIKKASATDSQETNEMMFKLGIGLIAVVAVAVGASAYRKNK